jgi:excisionase family DNA binding protein
MEKICIVKRRKKDVELVFSGFDNREQPAERRRETDLPAYTVSDVHFSAAGGGVEAGNDFSGERRFSVELTPAQAASIQSLDFFTYLSGAKRKRAGFDFFEEEKKIVFNFNFTAVPAVTMLSGKDVSRMLSVSRSFIRGLVRSGTMKSYKIGRLRRFLLDDILDYMCRAEGTSIQGNDGKAR